MAKFQKGQSGNPGGRPREVAEIKALARQHTEEAVNALLEIMRDPVATASARVSAATAILDRGFSKPAQEVRAELAVAPREITDEELARRLLFNARLVDLEREQKGLPPLEAETVQ